MEKLPNEYQELITLGIDKTANLPDLNDMTDRGEYPMKPWTARKTVGTIKLIKEYNITDEELLVEKFQEFSKLSLQTLTDQVYEYQKRYFGDYKYNKNTIFKYTYCCIIINSLKGNSTEKKFDRWANSNNIKTTQPHTVLDEKFHTDRLEINSSHELIGFISIKPKSFLNNYLQYRDVFEGLQLLTKLTSFPWKIYAKSDQGFKLIQLTSLNSTEQIKIKNMALTYSEDEIKELKNILKKYKF